MIAWWYSSGMFASGLLIGAGLGMMVVARIKNAEIEALKRESD